VIDTETGKVVQALDNLGGADDTVYYDAATPDGSICPGTNGTVAVFQEVEPVSLPACRTSSDGSSVEKWPVVPNGSVLLTVPSTSSSLHPMGQKTQGPDLRAD